MLKTNVLYYLFKWTKTNIIRVIFFFSALWTLRNPQLHHNSLTELSTVLPTKGHTSVGVYCVRMTRSTIACACLLTCWYDVINAGLRLRGQWVGRPAEKCAVIDDFKLDRSYTFVRVGDVDQTRNRVVKCPPERRGSGIAVHVALDPCSFAFVRPVDVLLVSLTRRFV